MAKHVALSTQQAWTILLVHVLTFFPCLLAYLLISKAQLGLAELGVLPVGGLVIALPVLALVLIRPPLTRKLVVLALPVVFIFTGLASTSVMWWIDGLSGKAWYPGDSFSSDASRYLFFVYPAALLWMGALLRSWKYLRVTRNKEFSLHALPDSRVNEVRSTQRVDGSPADSWIESQTDEPSARVQVDRTHEHVWKVLAAHAATFLVCLACYLVFVQTWLVVLVFPLLYVGPLAVALAASVLNLRWQPLPPWVVLLILPLVLYVMGFVACGVAWLLTGLNPGDFPLSPVGWTRGTLYGPYSLFGVPAAVMWVACLLRTWLHEMPSHAEQPQLQG